MARSRRVIWGALAVLGVACATTKGVQQQAAQAGPAQPAVPADPLDLVVWSPEAVAVAQVEQLRSSPWFPRLQPYIERAACVKLADWDALLAATRRLAIAARTKSDGEQWLLVLDGRYAQDDAQRLLGVARKNAPASPASPASSATGGAARKAVGRFEVSEDGGLAASVLDSRMLVIGSQPWVQAALDSLAHPVAKVSDTPLWRELGAQQSCTERSACLLSVANGFGARGLQVGLSSAGARSLGEQLVGSDSALGLTLAEGLSLGVSARLASPDAAQSAQQQLRDWLWQVNLLIRLTGLPAVVDAAKLSAEQNVMRGALDVSKTDLEAYDQRARPLFEQAVPSCNAE